MSNNIIICINLAQESILCFRRQNWHRALKWIREFSLQFSVLIQDIMENISYFQQLDYEPDLEYIVSVLSGAMSAQESSDYVLTADLLELQMLPWLMQLQEVLIIHQEIVMDESVYIDNVGGISRRDTKLAKQIEECNLSDACELELTSSGLYTMKVTDNSGSYYFHSNNNPMSEARIFAEQYYTMGESHYVVLGLGLGYHIQAMLEMDDGIYIDIIESDLEVIKTTCQIRDLSWIYDNPRVHLVYDKDFHILPRKLSESVQLVIHSPSLRHIQNEEIKLQLEKIFIRDSGIRNMAIPFENNFRDNIVNCDEYVDELESEFAGKNAIIVAAGPSLDKNVELLRNLSDNTVVVAVGTVFRKLVELGIRPNYVIFLDAQTHMVKQIEGLEQETIPIICASTACKTIASTYQGKKYLICQNGYNKAEAHATQQGYRLYETGGSVSTIALDLCLQLGVKNVAFIGLDLAYTNNRSHAVGTLDCAESDDNDKFYVPAINGGEVYATRLFIIYREWIERRVSQITDGVKVIDATEGGALKRGLIVRTLQETLEQWKK